MKILTIIGTRPEIIRLSLIIKKLDDHCQHIVIHTGQNYDYELNEIFYNDLDLREPDYFLEVNPKSLGSVLGETLIKIEPVLKKETPDAVLILGDTNSSIACIMAKRLRIPIYHMEAGNRAFDANIPEEINRKIIDHLADFNLVYTEHARRNLISESFPQKRIYLSGSPMFEVINYYKKKIEKSKIIEELDIAPMEYFVFSFHREENVDNMDNLYKILEIIELVRSTFKKKVIISVHPRTRKQLKNISGFEQKEDTILHKPFCFTDYMKLQLNSYCVISDSGTISEESAILNFPAITIRNSMERPEAMDSGTIMLTGLDCDVVVKAVEIVTRKSNTVTALYPIEYNIPDTSERVIRLMLGTAKLSNKWHGIEYEKLKS